MKERGVGALRCCPEEGGEAPNVCKIDAESSNAGERRHRALDEVFKPILVIIANWRAASFYPRSPKKGRASKGSAVFTLTTG
jgi:hypothetical protein